jgi:hypothetical protein
MEANERNEKSLIKLYKLLNTPKRIPLAIYIHSAVQEIFWIYVFHL